MDLMGTFLYGVVMKDLNPELSRAKVPSKLMAEKLNAGNSGMESGEGFYRYPENQKETFEKDFLKFSEIIKGLMEKYPFKDKNICTK
jgi:3-hydroxybutyryl-CoA dehydrogenase